MPSATLLPSALHAVLETANQFRAECGELEQHVEQLQSELDQANAALVEKAHTLRRERARLADREQQLSEQQAQNERLTLQFEHQEARLVEAVQEIRQLREFTVTAAAVGNESGESAALAAERDTLRSQLASAHHELLKLGQVVQELTQVREADAEASPSAEETAEQAAHITQLEQERLMLEAELELVRRRAGELSEAVAEHKRELATSRAEAAAELHEVRQLLEQQGKLLVARAGGASAAPTVTGELAAAPAGDAPHDPVIDSVMAQFARLQKDVNQRRLRKK